MINRLYSRIFAITFFMGMSALFLPLPALSAESATALKTGEMAPDFSLRDEKGVMHDLKDYRGKIVILQWTNHDCPYIQKHYARKTFTGMYAKLDPSKVVWLAVNSTHYNTPALSVKAKKVNNLPYPILQDASGAVGKLYGAKTTPHMFVIDAKGILRYAGAVDNDPYGDETSPINYVEQAVASLLEGKPPVTPSTPPYGCSVKYAKK